MLPGQKASDVQLTEDEKRRLRVMLWEDGFRDQSAEKTQAKRMSTALDSILSMRLDDEDED